MITYGEAYTAFKFSMVMVNGEWRGTMPYGHAPKMKRPDAAKYYTEKINKFWDEIGLKRKKNAKIETWVSRSFEVVDSVEVDAEPTLKDFKNVNDYYDYFEALRLKKRVLKSA